MMTRIVTIQQIKLSTQRYPKRLKPRKRKGKVANVQGRKGSEE